MRYWLYENWQAHGHGVRVHASSCSYCNDGQGVHKTDNETNGKWHGRTPRVKRRTPRQDHCLG